MSIHKKNIKLLEQFEKQIKESADTKSNNNKVKPNTAQPRPAK